MRRVVPSVVVAVALLAVAAPSASAAPTRAEYAVEVNIICSETNADIERVSRKISRKKGIGQIVRLSDRVNDLLEAELGRLVLVPPAPGDEALVASWLESERHLLELGTEGNKLLKKFFKFLKSPGANRKKLGEYGRKLKRSSNEIQEAAEVTAGLAGQLGATECGGDPSNGPFILPA